MIGFIGNVNPVLCSTRNARCATTTQSTQLYQIVRYTNLNVLFVNKDITFKEDYVCPVQQLVWAVITAVRMVWTALTAIKLKTIS